MKRLILAVTLALGIARGQTWTHYDGATLNPPYFTSWNYANYDPVSKTTLHYVNDQGNSIYSNSLWSWNAGTNSIIKIGTSGSTGSNGSSCPGNTSSWPGDRHPVGQNVIDYVHNRMFLFGGTDYNGCMVVWQDMYRMSLNTNPALDTWTHLANPTHFPDGNTQLGCTFDGDDNVIFCYGRDAGSSSLNNTVYCPTDVNPTPGTLTAVQTAAGCTAADDFSVVTVSGTQPTDDFTPKLVYDTINKKIIFLGAYTGGPTLASLELSVYSVPTKTWTPQSPTGTPGTPAPHDSGNLLGVPMDFNPNDGKIYYFRTDPTANGLYTWKVGDAAWTTVCTSCTATTGGLELGFNTVNLTVNANQNALILWSNSNINNPATSDDGQIIKGQLSSVYAPITITEENGTPTTNYPIQVGRVFAQGVVTGYPQAVVNGTPVTTQANVQSRWPDTSPKHVIISFLIPTLAANSTATVAFQNQATCQCGSSNRLSQSTMLGSPYNFDANIIFTNGVSATSSARTMLSANSFVYAAPNGWEVDGSVNTCILLGDDSTSRIYDVGSDSNKSIRPHFEACFWPTINQVRVRLGAEISDVDVLQDQFYDVQLTVGNTSPATKLTQTGIGHQALARWSREFWISTAPTAIQINHDFNYLKTTKQLFNYNPAATPTATAELALWNASAHTNIYDPGIWDIYMLDPAGRQEIAPLPDWIVLWAYTQDYGLWDMTTRMAELSTSWPIHWREADATRNGVTRYFDQANTVAGIGLPVMPAGRPTMTMNNSSGAAWTLSYDKVTPLSSSAPFLTSAVNASVTTLPVSTSAGFTIPGSSGTNTLVVLDSESINCTGRTATSFTSCTRGYGGSTAASHVINTGVGGQWTPDQSHSFEPWSIPYLLTGEFFYLEEMQFWHSYGAMNDFGPSSVPYGRGPTGAEEGLDNEQVRAMAWIFRNRTHLAYWAPDNGVTNEYIQSVADALAGQEGGHGITTGIYNGNAMWTWQNSLPGGFRDGANTASPLGIYTIGDPRFTTGINPAVASTGNSDYEENYFTIAFGRAIELGYSASTMLAFNGKRPIGEATDPGYNLYLASSYHEPALGLGSNWLASTWTVERTGFTAPNPTTWVDANCSDCYRYIFMAALSFTTSLSNGASAWTTVSGLLLGDPVISADPQLAIIPRNAVGPTVSGSTISGTFKLGGSATIH